MSQKRKSLKEYTPKQVAFFYWYSVLGNATKASLKVSYPDFPIDKAYSDLTDKERKNYKTAGVMGCEYLAKLKNPMQMFLDAQGLDLKKLAYKLEQGMEATKTSNAAILITKNGKTEKAEEQGLIEVPDYGERRQWWDRFARMLNVSVKEFPPVVATQQQVNVFGNATKNSNEFIEGEEV